eukprot:gb/GFBE01006374.1/.p1 GENE.gb/GFBE01006374.1/~~gb/GFBE01006374.1/.p1  ORF type:complete len:530 (+),score=90.97 gb/GFBE01006374.1/:1-1590(+)
MNALVLESMMVASMTATLFAIILCMFATDSRVLMCMTAAQTCSHVMLTIRWNRLVLLEVCNLLYVICLLLGSAEGLLGIFNLILLLGSTWFVSCGCRSVEQEERRAFLEIAKQKVLRFQSDFQLSRMQQASPEHDPMPQSKLSCDNSSMASDARSVYVFEMARLLDKMDTVEDKDTAVSKLIGLMRGMAVDEHWFIDSESIQLLPDKHLGNGSYGIVIPGRMHGFAVAVKAARKTTGAARLKALAIELRIFRRLRHPCIVQFHGACFDVERAEIAVVEELVDGLPLDRFVNNSSPTQHPKEVWRHVLLCVCMALRYMHNLTPEVVHGDLKPSNVLIESKTFTSKLIDFGLSRVIQKGMGALGGTAIYASPEVFLREDASPAADVFSFGRLAFFVLTGEKPMKGFSKDDLQEFAQRGVVPRLAWPDTCAEADLEVYKETLEPCLRVAPQDRVTSKDLHVLIWAWPVDPTFDIAQHSFLYSQSATTDSTGLMLDPSAELDQGAECWCDILSSARGEKLQEPNGKLVQPLQL